MGTGSETVACGRECRSTWRGASRRISWWRWTGGPASTSPRGETKPPSPRPDRRLARRTAVCLAARGKRGAGGGSGGRGGVSAARGGGAHPGGSWGGGGGGPRLQRAAGGNKTPDPAARTGAWRGDPRHDGGADGARGRG